jgi:hypothetical protein
MDFDLLPLFQWFYSTWLGDTIRNSTWLFPIFEAFHLLALGIIAGAVMVVDFRLLGMLLNKQPVALLADNARPYLLGALLVMFTTGIPLFLSEAIKCLYSFAFWVKMISLFLVLIWAFTVRSRVTHSDIAKEPALAKATAVVSLLLWFGVAWGGRWIGFS